MIAWKWLPLAYRRRRLAHALPAGALRRCLQSSLPSRRTDCRDVEFVVLDFETTGFDPRCDDIVSVGWVVIRAAAVDLGTARRRLVQPSRDIPESSAVIHAITDDEAANGEPLCDVLRDLLGVLAGRVLVAHYALAETGFLDAACRRCFGGVVPLLTVDTLALARRSLLRKGGVIRRGDLRLDAVRAGYGLPPHAMHDALGDAIAAGELLLAQMAELAGDGRLPLRAILAG